MKKAAITGIAGQDGTYLARLLLEKGYAVSGLLQFPFDREEAGLRRRFSAEAMTAIRWQTGSLEDPFSLFRFLKESKPDEIYHLAGQSDPRQSFIVPEEYLISVGFGTLRLLEAARQVCPEARFFLASSSETFGAPERNPQDENTPMRPVTPYGVAKLAADQFARIHRDKYQQFVAIGILYNHESPLRPPNFLSCRVAQGVAAIKQGRARGLELFNLDSERDWSDARDFVRGFWQMLQADQPGDFVLASGVPRTVRDLVECAFRAADLDYREFVSVRPPEGTNQTVSKGLCGCARRAETVLPWRREWTFEQTMADLVHAELEGRPEIERAHPTPVRRG